MMVNDRFYVGPEGFRRFIDGKVCQYNELGTARIMLE